MKFLLAICLLYGSYCNGQSQNKIKFESGLTFEQIKEKAKAENKYIFVDCYATWCTLCKKMDATTFEDTLIINLLNTDFISVKVQMDSSGQDNYATKAFYSDAGTIRHLYEIKSLPSYLFFAPSGAIVHKAIGVKHVNDFLNLLANAINPKKQYYPLLKKYEQKNLDYVDMEYLAKVADGIGDKKMGNIIAQYYIDNYLIRKQKKDLLTKNNILFIKQFTHTSKDKGFDFFYQNYNEVDSVMENKGFSNKMLDLIIAKEEIDTALVGVIDRKESILIWKKLFDNIKRKYSICYAERIVLDGQERFYNYMKNWSELHKVYVKRYKKYGIQHIPNEGDNPYGVTNNMAWEIFEHSMIKKHLKLATEWMGIIVMNTRRNDIIKAAYMDTYANLLYKTNKARQAIEWEMQAIQLAKNLGDNKAENFFLDILNKMKRGEKIWETEEK